MEWIPWLTGASCLVASLTLPSKFMANYTISSTARLINNIVLEGLAAVVNRVTYSAPVPGSTLYVHACHPRGALPAPGLAGCPVCRGE
jgi:hypothetical protein